MTRARPCGATTWASEGRAAHPGEVAALYRHRFLASAYFATFGPMALTDVYDNDQIFGNPIIVGVEYSPRHLLRGHPRLLQLHRRRGHRGLSRHDGERPRRSPQCPAHAGRSASSGLPRHTVARRSTVSGRVLRRMPRGNTAAGELLDAATSASGSKQRIRGIQPPQAPPRNPHHPPPAGTALGAPAAPPRLGGARCRGRPGSSVYVSFGRSSPRPARWRRRGCPPQRRQRPSSPRGAAVRVTPRGPQPDLGEERGQVVRPVVQVRGLSLELFAQELTKRQLRCRYCSRRQEEYSGASIAH